MQYTTINTENFAEIYFKTQETKNWAIAHKDSYGRCQSSCSFAIMGMDAIERFIEEHHVGNTNMPTAIKTDGKTRAKVIPCMFVGYYFDYNESFGDCKGYFHNAYNGYLVEFDGLLLSCYKPQYNKEMCRFTILGDDVSEYREYLPYNWEDEHPAPNNVGTLTDKKMQTWKDFLLARSQERDNRKNERMSKEAAFLERIDKMQKEGCTEVKIGNNRGYIVKNGLMLSWEITTYHYVCTKLSIWTFNDGKDDLQRFQEMSEGVYKGK